MAELKEKMQRFNQNLNAVKENFSSQNEETTKSPQPAVVINIESKAAHIKFKDLASADMDISCTLTLPSSYSQLLDSFKGSDTIVKFLYNRQEVCTFLKLKMGIQNITKHTFGLNHLAQIKTVYPMAYLFKQEKMFIDFKNDFHLTVYPNLDGKL
jgi:chromatin licensing and DNA replication factor 1